MRLLTLSLLLLTGLLCPAEEQAPPQRPNIVIIYADDLGVMDSSVAGSKLYETPNIDRLAKEGMSFAQAYSAFPRCVPSRQALLSGKYPCRLEAASGRKEHSLPLAETSFGEALKNAGYDTTYIGKWHLGHDAAGYPDKQGFTTAIHTGSAGATDNYFFPFQPEKKHEVINPVSGKDGDYLTDLLTQAAVQKIRDSRKESPFLIVLAHYAVHTPFQAKPELVAKYQAKLKALGLAEGGLKDDADFKLDGSGYAKTVQNNAVYAAMLESLDQSVGAIEAALKAKGLEKNTVILFSSDHGGLSSRGLKNKRPVATSNLPYRHGKGWVYEGGIRVPLIVKWPGHVAAGAVSQVQVTGTDHFPTLLQLAGLPLMPQQHLDGQSYFPALQGKSYQRGPMFWYSHTARPTSTGDLPGMAWIEGHHKILEWFDDGRVELFDLAKDPGEQHDLAKEQPALCAELLKKMRDFEAGIGGDLRAKGKEATYKRIEKKGEAKGKKADGDGE
ncbi:MAG: hypothetical protein RL095_3985 [Verrucomicrobiota bacterium]|jgi:arylsulfatase A-like enzyme